MTDGDLSSSLFFNGRRLPKSHVSSVELYHGDDWFGWNKGYAVCKSYDTKSPTGTIHLFDFFGASPMKSI